MSCFAWSELGRFERRASVHTWLYRIATNTCLDELERTPRRPEPVVDPYPDARLADAGVPLSDPAARYAAREGVELAFLTAIQRLPGRQRAILVLRDVLGWTGAEVADLLDSTVAAVNSALQRARATVDVQIPVRPSRPRRPADRALLADLVDAWERDDIDGLVALLHDDAVLEMPPHPAVVGAVAIGGFFAAVRARHDRLTATATWANGRPAVAIRERATDGSARPHRLLVLEVGDDRVTGLSAHGSTRLLELFDV